MNKLLEPIYIVLLFVVIRAGDIAINAAIARDTIRAILYGIVALLALIVLILAMFGVR